MPLLTRNHRMFGAWTFSGCALGCLAYLAKVFLDQPLFPLKMTNPVWLASWLKIAVVDYYGAAVPLSLIAIMSEEGLWRGGLWALGFCLIGSPATLAYTAYRLYYKTLALGQHDPFLDDAVIKKKKDDDTPSAEPVKITLSK